ncbi:MAG TPA: NAD(+) diphosphatase [Xanthobacteraceae bacterium]|nr:NAD(+) diphosphatase [Xanthobacteraceae bacterium]
MANFPELGPKSRLGYTASLLDRMAQRRDDEAAIAKLRDHPEAGVHVIGGELIVLKSMGDSGAESCDPLFSPAEAHALGAVRESVFLGALKDVPRFGFGLDPQAVEALKARNDLKVTDLRSIAVQGLVGADDLPPLAEAKALLGWHARHRFCSNCGSPTQLVQAGWRRDCPVCKAQHFPRTDPVVIMLVIAGERCVLGRSPRFAPTMWSCLAGFIEPGETIEEAVRREVQEEVGVICGKVKYFASQPWPFPSSLMIGCHAQALSDEIVIDPDEIEAARWFDRAELATMLRREHKEGLTTPPPVAIAHHIIRDFVENGSDVIG